MRKSHVLMLCTLTLGLASCGNSVTDTALGKANAPQVQASNELNGTLMNFDPTAPGFDPQKVVYDPRGLGEEFQTLSLEDRPALVTDPPLDNASTAYPQAIGSEGAGIVATNPIPLSALSGLEKQMAQVYNARAAYFAKIEQQYGIPSSVMAAIMLAESGSAAYTTDWQSLKGRNMTIRFENHQFYNYWGKSNPNTFNAHFKYNATQPWTGHMYNPSGTWLSVHTGQQQREWDTFDYAARLSSVNTAANAISMGMGQIMGFNYGMLKYSNPEAMFNGFQTGAMAQLDGIVDFLIARKLLDAMRRADFHTVASNYNGTGKADEYAKIIKDRYDAYNSVLRKYPR